MNRSATPTEGSEGSDVPRIQAVDRAIALLKVIAESAAPQTALELARTCNINRSTAWRLLRTMEYHGLVDRNPVTQRYSIGSAAVSIGGAAAGGDDILRRARPLLAELAALTGEAANLSMLERTHLVSVEQVDPPYSTLPSWTGKELPLHATSGGKIFLAWMTSGERQASLQKSLQRFTERTITDRDLLDRDLKKVRRNGYSLCAREYDHFTSGASAPVFGPQGTPIAVVSVWGPAQRNPYARLNEHGKAAARTASQLTDLLTDLVRLQSPHYKPPAGLRRPSNLQRQ
jgi:DNA-binding IclR family transcriptional regulator